MAKMLLQTDAFVRPPHTRRRREMRMANLQSGAGPRLRGGSELRIALATALVYVLTSASLLWPAGASGPMWLPVPAAGIALAAVLILGRAALVGVLVGAAMTCAHL